MGLEPPDNAEQFCAWLEEHGIDTEGREAYSKPPCWVCGIEDSNPSRLCEKHSPQWYEESKSKPPSRGKFVKWIIDHPDFNLKEEVRPLSYGYCGGCGQKAVRDPSDYLCEQCRHA